MKLSINEAKKALQLTVDDPTQQDIEKAYRRVALQCHPDKTRQPGEAEQFKRLGDAKGRNSRSDFSILNF